MSSLAASFFSLTPNFSFFSSLRRRKKKKLTFLSVTGIDWFEAVFENKPKLPTRLTLVRPSLSCPTARPPVRPLVCVCIRTRMWCIRGMSHHKTTTTAGHHRAAHKHKHTHTHTCMYACMHVRERANQKKKKTVKRGREGGPLAVLFVAVM